MRETKRTLSGRAWLSRWIVSVATAVLVAGCAGGTAPSSEEIVADGLHRYEVTVEGMSCPEECGPKVEAMLRGVEGVRDVRIDFDRRVAVVTAEPGRSLTQQACGEALAGSDYAVTAFREIGAS